jgi:type VI secretion system protein ImpJ
MRSLSPVVWFEGMHLGPHQFQAQNRYFQDSIQFATSLLWFENYGLIGCELSAEALENGQAVLVHARGIFPDGLVFEMPDSDAIPPARDIAEAFPPTRSKVTVYLAVPPERIDQRNYDLEATATRKTRFIAESRPLFDETTGRDERAIQLGRKNLRLLLETEEAGDLVRLPIARITRSGSGRFVLDPAFIPPCLDITASSRLMAMLGRMVGLLEDRSSSLALSAGEQPSASLHELTRFWFLHTINASLVPLRHLYSARRGHPEELFLELSRLAGALCTFSLDSHPRSLPRYDHLHLDDGFDALDLHIRRHLEIVIPTSCLRIPLAADGEYFFKGDVVDQRCFGPSSWILGVRGGGPENEVISKTPTLVKVCSRAFVPELVKRALPGFTLTHLPSPPSAVPTRPDTQYFQVNKGGPCWDHINKTKQVGVYVPGELPNPQVELLVVVDPTS